MSVIPFTPPSAFELEGRALKKIVDLTLALPAYVAAHEAARDMGPESEESARVAQALALLQFLDDTLAALEDIAAPALIDIHKGATASAVLHIQCSLTNLRMKAFAEIRSSRVFVNDFAILLEEKEFTPALFAA